ncbi:unnamed protein product [Urochloa humidicola]
MLVFKLNFLIILSRNGNHKARRVLSSAWKHSSITTWTRSGSGGKDKDIDKVGSVSSAWGSRTAPAAALQPRLDSNSPMPAQ